MRKLFALIAFLPVLAFAQSYPAKPIRLIVPFPAGGGVDFIGRIIGQGLTPRLGQQVAVDNRAGANGIVGLEVLKTSAPDGYTIAAASAGPLVVNPFIYAKLPYDTLKDFTHIANMVNFPLLLVAHPSLPAKNVKDLIALARAQPGQVTYSHPGTGNTGHLAGEIFNSLAKVKILGSPTEDGLLKYDTQVKRCPTCYVNSYRVGFISIRRPVESWEELERRVHTMRRADFPAWARIPSTSTQDLDPDVAGKFDAIEHATTARAAQPSDFERAQYQRIACRLD